MTLREAPEWNNVELVPRLPARSPRAVLQLKLTLEDIEPPVWRRVLVPAAVFLPRLHRILNETMGWENAHLHAFEFGARRFVDPSIVESMLDDDERRVRIGELVGPGGSFLYEYDFGDGWSLRVHVEDVRDAEPGVVLPACVDGARACPPEDCGGPPGYADFLAALEDAQHPEHDRVREWVGGVFDPEGFDVNRTNAALRRLASRK